jgi:hypothetical protein
MGMFKFFFGWGDDDENKEWEEIEVKHTDEGEWEEANVENDPSSEEGAEYHCENEITGDGGDAEAFDTMYANMQETLYQPPKKGGIFDWLLGN